MQMIFLPAKTWYLISVLVRPNRKIVPPPLHACKIDTCRPQTLRHGCSPTRAQRRPSSTHLCGKPVRRHRSALAGSRKVAACSRALDQVRRGEFSFTTEWRTRKHHTGRSASPLLTRKPPAAPFTSEKAELHTCGAGLSASHVEILVGQQGVSDRCGSQDSGCFVSPQRWDSSSPDFIFSPTSRGGQKLRRAILDRCRGTNLARRQDLFSSDFKVHGIRHLLQGYRLVWGS